MDSLRIWDDVKQRDPKACQKKGAAERDPMRGRKRWVLT